MNPTLPRKALDLFESALDWPETERAARLAELCRGEPALLEAVQRLMQADLAARHTFPTELPPAMGLTGLGAYIPPERIGVYKLNGLLGEGGMGAVYRGERDDGLFEQTVAIKLVRPGLFSRAAAELFAMERRILAKLQHPNIAQLFDGGVEEGGAPYIVMEYLDGLAVTQYAAENKLNTRERVLLFRTACTAVQHAHQNLVAHGDIKPSNIMVTRSGVVKLLDFGIARLTDAADSILKQPQAFTRAYASPDRAKGAPATALSDIWSLGLVLQELSSDLPHPHADLQAIVKKATRERHEDRYAGVSELIDDINRHLDMRPVRARPATWRYVTGRLIARNRWIVTGIAAAFLILTASALVATTLYLRAERLRADANHRFNDVRHMANFMLFDLYDQMGHVPGSVKMRGEVANQGRIYLQTLASIPGAPADLQLEAAQGYARLGEVLGAPGAFHLGQPEEAKRNLAIAGHMLNTLHTQQPQRNDITVALARVLVLQASIASSVDFDAPTATRLSESARKLCDVVLARDSNNMLAMLTRWSAQNTLANVLGWQNRMTEVVKVMREQLEYADSVPFEPPLIEERVMLEAGSRTSLGDALYYTDDMAGSLASYRAAAQVIERTHAGADDPRYLEQLGLIYWDMGGVLADLNRDTAADEALTRSTQTLQRSIDYGSNERTERLLQSVQLQHALVLSKLGQTARAIELGEASMANREKRLAAQPKDRERQRDLAVGLRPLGDVYAAAKRHDAACSTYTRAQQSWAAIEKGGAMAKFDRDGEFKMVGPRLKAACSKKSPAEAGL